MTIHILTKSYSVKCLHDKDEVSPKVRSEVFVILIQSPLQHLAPHLGKGTHRTMMRIPSPFLAVECLV